MAKKVIRITESQLRERIQLILNEQQRDRDYRSLADALYNNMKGLSMPSDSDHVYSILYNNVKTRSDWDSLRKAFGIRDGENLGQWLKGEMHIDYMKLINQLDQTMSQSSAEDRMYNPGSKIKNITNKQFLIARAYQYSDVMNGKVETELSITDSTVVRRDAKGFVIKAKYVYFYDVSEYKAGQIPKQQTLYNVCLRIDFKDVIEWTDDVLQIQWHSNFVKGNIVPCQ